MFEKNFEQRSRSSNDRLFASMKFYESSLYEISLRVQEQEFSRERVEFVGKEATILRK